MDDNKLRLGISTCLLGAKVRYDGGHKLDQWIKNTLGQFAQFTAICPEHECGMSIPRPSMHLEGTIEAPRLIQTKSGIDLTNQMNIWIKKKLKELKNVEMDGYIFKTKSPSSGLRNIKIFLKDGKLASSTGAGLFAKAFTEAFPLIPVEDEERLHDPKHRENFIELIFVMKRWRKLLKEKKSLNNLITFHTRHKLLIMSHSLVHYKNMGKILSHNKKDISSLYQEYHQMLIEALRLHTSIKKHFNVLQHALGYFKKYLSGEEKQEMLAILNQYKDGLIPLIVPITLMNHFNKKYNQTYLLDQYYFNPHPLELKIRNHV